MNEVPIIVSGSIAIDRIMSFDGSYQDYIQPEKVASLSISIFLKSLTDAPGGVGANIAYSLALLGTQPVLLGSVGPDAADYMESLARKGVDITAVHHSTLPTASFNVMTDSDQNQIGGFYPGAMFDSSTLTFTPWKDKNPIVVISPHDPKAMERQVRECQDLELRLCYDIGQQVSNLAGDEMRLGVEAAEILILNEYELVILSKKTGLSSEKIKDIVPVVITTFGQRGSVIEGSSVAQAISVGVAEVKKVADPTGAGDAFRSGFLYGYARGWSLLVSARLGAVCAAYAIEAIGTQNHSFTFRQVAERYQEAFHESLPKLNK